MRKLFVLPIILIATPALANEISLADAMANARKHCSGISEQLNDIKKLAGVGTAMSAVGMVGAAGATAAGVVKKEFDDASNLLAKYQTVESQPKQVEMLAELNTLVSQVATLTNNEEFQDYADTLQSLQTTDETEAKRVNQAITKAENVDIDETKQIVDDTSKKLGDARTGLMATATATNIAGAVISGTNQVKTDLITQIGACAGAIQTLSNMKMQASLDGSATDEEIAHADKVISACNKYNLEDVKKINTRATGATVSSGIGAATGLAGTITSGIANTDPTRENAEKAKNLNTASNVLAGVTTAASLTSTVFNATQISAAKRVIETAEQCEEALK
ncbi:MAG: hypothetical protein J6R99_01715 [Alphaproteobacteria bacterium]|nr:hypothetical protein [Alphaproteobacteria bacterium]